MLLLPAIEEVVETFKRAQLAGDAAAAAALFSEDAVMYPPVAEVVVRGRPAIDQLLHAVHRRLQILEVNYGPLSGQAVSDMAYVHWRYVLRVQPLATGAAPSTMRGRLLWVLVRRGGEGWRVAAHHASLEPQAPSVSSPPAGKP